jgi:tRNA pseudouridine55 synthase
MLKARWLFNAQKAGHTGTLDPLASGLLPICLGEATKFSADLLHAEKTYVARIRFGEKSSTGDAEGEIIERGSSDFTEEMLKEALKAFEGETEQVPPMYSALKRDGKPLYELAREGKSVEREARKITVSHIELLEFNPPEAVISARVSKGTYIRVLAEDIAAKLGTVAHLTALRRTGVGSLTLEGSVTLEELERLSPEERRMRLLPVDSLIATLPAVELTGADAEAFRHGMRRRLPEEYPEGKVRVYENKDGTRQLLGCARIEEKTLLVPERLINFALATTN